MLAFEESGKKSPSESRFECKKKEFSKGPTKNDFYPPNAKFLISMDVPEDDDDALLVFMLLMKREPRRAKKQPNRKEPFSPRSSVSSLSVPKEKRERETNEKEIQRYLKLRLVSRSLPFSSRCGCFSLVRKKTTKIV